jgi:hypothetical protein
VVVENDGKLDPLVLALLYAEHIGTTGRPFLVCFRWLNGIFSMLGQNGSERECQRANRKIILRSRSALIWRSARFTYVDLDSEFP